CPAFCSSSCYVWGGDLAVPRCGRSRDLATTEQVRTDSIETEHVLGMRPLEALLGKLLGEMCERQLPGVLPVIVKLPELLGVHAEFPGHLGLFVGQAMTALGLDPRDQFLGNLWLAHNGPRTGVPAKSGCPAGFHHGSHG